MQKKKRKKMLALLYHQINSEKLDRWTFSIDAHMQLSLKALLSHPGSYSLCSNCRKKKKRKPKRKTKKQNTRK